MPESLETSLNPTLSVPNFTTQKVCATCQFWENQRCHAHPPVATYEANSVAPGVGREVTRFPLTNPGDWCGEHQIQTKVHDPFVVKQSYNLP